MTAATAEVVDQNKSNKSGETVYVNDPDGKKFYEMTDHDAMCLAEGDLLIHNEVLRRVKNVKKKAMRGGTVWTVTLDNGFQFDPTVDCEPSISMNMRSIRYWHPRKGF